MMLDFVISGGQTGADIGGVAAGKSFQIATGGWMPLDWNTEEGPHPEYAPLYGMRMAIGGYAHRTKLNIKDSDGTLIIAMDWSSRGTMQTISVCETSGKPHFPVIMRSPAHMVFDPAQSPRDCAEWLKLHNIKTLNVAGNRESKAPGIGQWTFAYCRLVFVALALL
jgi:hypothetical protein